MDEGSQHPGHELESRQLGGKIFAHSQCCSFGNLSLRMPQSCPPVGSQEVGVVVSEEQKKTKETRNTADPEAGRGSMLA